MIQTNKIVINNIQKTFRNYIEKGGKKTGVYTNTPENIKLGRVGQKYSKEKESNLKYKVNSKGNYIKGEGFTIYKVDNDKHFNIKINSRAGWVTDSHSPNTLKLMDNGNVRGSIQIPNNYRISDITDKMFDLTKESTWGEKQGFTKNDYNEIFKLYLEMK